MKKALTWILNHLGIILGVVVFAVTFAVIGSVMLNSKKSYEAYEKQFIETDLEIRSLSGAQPTSIEFIDDFKSEYKNRLDKMESKTMNMFAHAAYVFAPFPKLREP